MANNKHKSAKDIAFDRKLTKLRSTITVLREENGRLNVDNEAKDITIAELKSAVRQYQYELEKLTGVDIETYVRDMKNRDSIAQLLNIMKGVL